MQAAARQWMDHERLRIEDELPFTEGVVLRHEDADAKHPSHRGLALC